MPGGHFPVAGIPASPSTLAVVAEADYRIKLPVFEGPLDLLLFLIRKSELDIYDIPISTVTRQYLEVIYAMKDLQIEVAGEFFVMAATLMEIKSRMLLPKHQQAVDPNAEEDDLDPRWELVHQLLQYKKFKEAAGNLNQMALDAANKLARPASAFAPSSERPLQHVDRIEVWNSFNLVLRRLAEKLVVGEIHREQVTVADQMEYLLERIKTQKSFIFSHLFEEKITLRKLVATFLAVLELTRLKKLRVQQDESFSDILCTAVEEDPAAANAPAPELTSSFDTPAETEAAAEEKPLETAAEPTTVTGQDEESHPSPES